MSGNKEEDEEDNEGIEEEDNEDESNVFSPTLGSNVFEPSVSLPPDKDDEEIEEEGC